MRVISNTLRLEWKRGEESDGSGDFRRAPWEYAVVSGEAVFACPGGTIDKRTIEEAIRQGLDGLFHDDEKNPAHRRENLETMAAIQWALKPACTYVLTVDDIEPLITRPWEPSEED